MFMVTQTLCPMQERGNPSMKEFLLAYKKLKNATAQAYTFAIHTSRCTSQKLQKSMLISDNTRLIKDKK